MIGRKVLVLGGTGHFGRLLVDDLKRYVNCELVIMGLRSADLRNPASLEAALSGISIAICAAGPFQMLPATLAQLCLRQGIHYLDLADDRNFVRKIHSIISSEGESASAVCTGWSTVSALSGTLTQIGAEGLGEIDSVYIHMAPGNRVPRGAGTIASLFHSVGKPFTVFRDGKWLKVCGWTEKQDFDFPLPIGRRGGYLLDVPDHESFPSVFRTRTVEFRTASELLPLNAAVSFLGWCVRRGFVRTWAPWSRVFERTAAICSFLGHDWGGVGVEVNGAKGKRRVSVVAHSGGQRIAVMPASVMTGLLLSGSHHRGLVSPARWLTREQLNEECERRRFSLIVEEL